MHLIPIHTGHLSESDDLVSIIIESSDIKPNDILVISSKIVAMTNGDIIDLNKIEISDYAKKWAKEHKRDERMYQAILDETDRMNGKIINNDNRAILTELKPDGLKKGTIMAASAGLDRSNIEEGKAVGWPFDCIASINKLRSSIIDKLRSESEWGNDETLGIIITDSCLRPRRLGLTAQALVVSGFDPIVSQIGRLDLLGKPLTVTHEAVADQLATAANFLMGNADQAIPAVIARNHGLAFSEFEGWVDGIEIEEDLFRGVI